MNKVGLALVCMSASAIALAGNTTSLSFDQCQPRFQFSLPANPTTGYQWRLTNYDHKHFKLLKTSYQGPEKKLMGAGGMMVFQFGLQKGAHYPEKTRMTLVYAQPWNPKSGTEQRIKLRFTPCGKANNVAPNTDH